LNQKIIVFTILILVFLIIPNQTFGELLEKKCLFEGNEKTLDVWFVTGVQEFDEQNKKLLLTIDVDIEAKDPVEPFDVSMRISAHRGGGSIQIQENYDDDSYSRSQKFTEDEIIPTLNTPINLWPGEVYHIPIFLEFEQKVKFCYDVGVEGEHHDLDSYKAGYFPENPDWLVDLKESESSIEDMEKTIPGIKAKYTDPTIVKLDTIIYHTEDYYKKNIIYAIAPIFPILLIIAHFAFIKSEKLVTHVTFFTGVSILILTGVFIIRDSTPLDLTLVEAIPLSSIVFYAVGFFIFLWRFKKPIKCKEQKIYR